MLCKHCNREIENYGKDNFSHIEYPKYFWCNAYKNNNSSTWLTVAEPYDLGQDSLNILFSKEDLKDLI